MRGALHLRTFFNLSTFFDFNYALFSHPNQDQLVISGHETMTCTSNCTDVKNEVSDVFIGLKVILFALYGIYRS